MKFAYTNKAPYAEEGQPNPLRWCILSGTPETGFVNESAWLRCKDFFNDYAVAYNGGQRFIIYGFSTENMNIPAKGEPVWMALKDDTDCFSNNIYAVNEYLPEPLTVVSAEYDNEHTFICIPAYYFNNTYNTSLVSLIIRLCNIPHQFGSWKEFTEYKEFPTKDQDKWNLVVAKGKYFNLPEKLAKYTWYAGPDHNSETKDMPVYQLSSLVHNGGVLNYMKFF